MEIIVKAIRAPVKEVDRVPAKALFMETDITTMGALSTAAPTARDQAAVLARVKAALVLE